MQNQGQISLYFSTRAVSEQAEVRICNKKASLSRIENNKTSVERFEDGWKAVLNISVLQDSSQPDVST